MFNCSSKERFSFCSNPPIREVCQVVPEEVDGVVRNKVVSVPGSNHSPLEGTHFSADTMSLRAKLNLGVKMSQVFIGQLENDPNVLANRALHFEREIYSRFDEIEKVSVSEPEPVNE